MNDVQRTGGGADLLAGAVLRLPVHRLLTRRRLLLSGGAGVGAVAPRCLEEEGRLWIADRRPWVGTLRPLSPVVVHVRGAAGLATPQVVRDEVERASMRRALVRTHGAVRRWVRVRSLAGTSDAELLRRAATAGAGVARLHPDLDGSTH